MSTGSTLFYGVDVNFRNAPLLLRPLHRWFWFWERRISSVYRVVAVLVAALFSAWIVVLVGVPYYVAVPIAIAAWIGLAVAQEHDERVTLPIDQEFYDRLRYHVDPVVAAAGLSFDAAIGANRARGGAETFTYQHHDEDEILWIFRNRSERVMGLSVWADDFDAEPSSLPDDLVERVTTVSDAESDAQAIASALEAWVQDGSIRLPDGTKRGHVFYRRIGGGWFNNGPVV